MSHSPISSTTRRVQEDYHRKRVAVANLANVRTISANSATAWARETRNGKSRSKDAMIELFSENPDRGRVDASTITLKGKL